MSQYAFKAHKFEAIPLPVIKEQRGKEWVNFGLENLFPQLLIDLYNSSAIHHTALTAKIAAVVGEGFKGEHGMIVVNTKGETLNEIFEKIATDYMIFGGYALNVIWSRDGESIAEMYHLPFNTVRSGKMNEDEVIESYWYSADWADRRCKPVRYKAYDLTDNEDENASQIYYYFDYTVGNHYYPLPQYQGALNDIDLDQRVSKFHNANVSNGISPSMMLTFKNGIPTEDKQDEIYADINATFAGEYNAGRFFLNFVDSPEKAPDLTPIQSANDSYYITLEERITSRILTAHRITSPLLLGIRDTGGGLGSNSEEIQVAFAHFIGTVIKPDQKALVKSLQKLVWQMNYTVKLEIEQSTIDFGTTIETTVIQNPENNL